MHGLGLEGVSNKETITEEGQMTNILNHPSPGLPEEASQLIIQSEIV